MSIDHMLYLCAPVIIFVISFFLSDNDKDKRYWHMPDLPEEAPGGGKTPPGVPPRPQPKGEGNPQ